MSARQWRDIVQTFNLITKFVCYKMQYPLRTTKSWLRVNKMDKWIDCADATRSGGYINPPLPVRIRCINTQYRASTWQMVCIIWWRVAVEFGKNGTLGRIYKSAPTHVGSLCHLNCSAPSNHGFHESNG